MMNPATGKLSENGPFEQLSSESLMGRWFNNPAISEIMINPDGQVYVEESGSVKREAYGFTQSRLHRIFELILYVTNGQCDAVNPFYDCVLPNGARVHLVVPPVIESGIACTIRCFSKTKFKLHHFFRDTEETAIARLADFMEKRKNILVCGATSSGKTTFLESLSSHIDKDQRVVVIEDTRELQISHQNTVLMCTHENRQTGMHHQKMGDLVRNALRMRPDRIIVGECRGPEAFDMIQAMHTGHAGCMATCHGNSANDTLHRLSVMVRMGLSGLQVSECKHLIARSIEVVVHLGRNTDGRFVTGIYQITGLDHGQFLLDPVWESGMSEF
jgi:pilus assembly protein CpaF